MVDQGTHNTFDALRFFLVGAVYRLSVDAETQIAYLDRILGFLSKTGDATGYGNDELALELEDAFLPLRDRKEEPCLSEAEKQAVTVLDNFLGRLGGEKHYEFWRRNALKTDYRWMEVRKLAKAALKEFEKSGELPPSEIMLGTGTVSQND